MTSDSAWAWDGTARDVMVQTFDTSTFLPVVPLTTTRTTTGTVVFTFTLAPLTNSIRVLVVG